MKNKLKYWPAWVVVGLMLVFFVWPLLQTIQGALVYNGRLTLVFVREALANPIYRTGLYNSLALACAITGMVILLGLPLAWLSVHYDFPGRTALSALILTPMILPPFVGAIGIRHILGQYGALNAILVRLGVVEWPQTVDWLANGRFWAVAVTAALHLYPIFYLNAQAAIAALDNSLTEAAANLGCIGWRRFIRVTLPLIMPGLFAGGIIVFIWAFTELGTPLMFDYNRVIAVQIYDGLNDIGASPPLRASPDNAGYLGPLYATARNFRTDRTSRPGPAGGNSSAAPVERRGRMGRRHFFHADISVRRPAPFGRHIEQHQPGVVPHGASFHPDRTTLPGRAQS